MGNDATVELSPVAGRNVLGIRDGIISDQTALRMLQEYIRIQCLGGYSNVHLVTQYLPWNSFPAYICLC
ncbi:lysis protein [Shigella flexneri]|uniref:lysis protein n=1 Tax=Shigella flexneri TaxID=623 RepID=UPI001EE77EF1|nr:lysis protein [Shigella flexneri]